MTDTDGQHQTEELRRLATQMSETNRLLGMFVQKIEGLEQRVGVLEHKVDDLATTVHRLEVRVSVLESAVETVKVHGASKADIHAAFHAYTWKMIAFVSALVAAAYTAGAIYGLA